MSSKYLKIRVQNCFSKISIEVGGCNLKEIQFE